MHRLHPLSVVFSVGLAVRRLLLPGLFVLLFRPGGQYDVWLMLLFLPAVAAAVIRYATHAYGLERDQLVVREGIVTRTERHIPYDRIQNIDLVQGPLQRWLGVAEVRVETASGERPEAVLRVLSLAAVERMRRHVFREHGPAGLASGAEDREPGAADAGREDDALLRVGWRELALLGLASHRGLAVVAAGLGLVWQLDPLGKVDEGWLRERLGQLDVSDSIALPAPMITAVVMTAGALAVLLVLAALSMAWAIVRYHGFTLRVRGDDLRTEYGLLTRITATIPRHRVQLLTIRHGPVLRAFGLRSVQVHTAGHGRPEEGHGAERLWLAPVVEEARVDELVRSVFIGRTPAHVTWRAVAPRAWRRLLVRGLATSVLVASLAALVVGPWALTLLAPGAALAGLHARLYVRYTAFAVTDKAVLYRSGWWTRSFSVVSLDKIHVLALRESPFDRRARMASLHVDTAARRAGRGVYLRYLDAPVAGDAMRSLALQKGPSPSGG